MKTTNQLVLDVIMAVTRLLNLTKDDVFNVRSSDKTYLIVTVEGVNIYLSPEYGYIDIIGLPDEQFNKLKDLLPQ